MPRPAASIGLPPSGNAELFSLMIGQGQFDLLRSNINRLFQMWDKEKRTCSEITEDLFFIMDLMKRKFSANKLLDCNIQSSCV